MLPFELTWELSSQAALFETCLSVLTLGEGLGKNSVCQSGTLKGEGMGRLNQKPGKGSPADQTASITVTELVLE